MHNPERNPSPTLWAASPTAKQKNAASRNVSLLLDALAPQQAVRRAEPPKLRIERYRTPEGAVLQAAHAALTLSWFPEATEASALGELRILVWKGIVARRGTTPAPSSARTSARSAARSSSASSA